MKGPCRLDIDDCGRPQVTKKAPKKAAKKAPAPAVARRAPSQRRQAATPASEPIIEPAAPTRGRRSARPRRVALHVGRLDFGGRPAGPAVDIPVDNTLEAPSPIKDELAATTLAAASPAQPVAVAYNGLTGEPVYVSGLPYCSLDGLCPPDIIADMRAKAYYAALYAPQIAAGTLPPW